MKIVFMGTAEFAVPSLRKLIENGVQVVSVVTAPDKPAGRGLKLAHSPVKEFALEAGLAILQPDRLRDETFLHRLSSLEADLFIVVAFRMLPRAIWQMPPLGTFNLHASLLPQYRGAAPINWVIIRGETKTGVTTFLIEREIDTGTIIFQEEEAISDDDNAGTLYERLKHKGADLVLKTARAIEMGNFPKKIQKDPPNLKLAPKIFKEDCQIDWRNKTEDVRNYIRGLAPYPAAWTRFNGKLFKILKVAEVNHEIPNGGAGDFLSDGKGFIHVRTANGCLAVDEIQAEGKRKMGVSDFLRGNTL